MTIKEVISVIVIALLVIITILSVYTMQIVQIEDEDGIDVDVVDALIDAKLEDWIDDDTDVIIVTPSAYNQSLNIGDSVEFGNIRSGGDITATGNITADNVFLPAYIRLGSRSTIPVSVGSVWENITFNQSATCLIQGFAHTHDDSTNDTITVNNSGIYAVTYFIACEDSAVNPDAHVGFRLINATDQTIIKGSYGEFDTSKKDMYIFKEHSFITSFENGDQIKVQFTSDDTTVTLTPHVTFNPSGPSCQLSMHKIANI